MSSAPPAPKTMSRSDIERPESRRTEGATLGGVILCGGRSRRMGRDKAELDLFGEALLDRVIAEVTPVASEILLACGPTPRYESRGMQLVLDGEPDAGPLAGIAAALEATGASRSLVVACDMPRVCTALFRALAERAEEEQLDVCWFESERGIEPLCAVYSRACATHMRSALADGRRKVTSFVGEGLRVGTVHERELAGELRSRDCAVNLNTPDDLAAEREVWSEETLP